MSEGKKQCRPATSSAFNMEEQLNSLTKSFGDLQKHLNAIADAFPDPIFIIDESGRYLEVLGGENRDLYLSSEYLKGKCLHDVLPRETADSFLDAISSAIRDGDLKLIEYRLGPADLQGSDGSGPEEEQWYEGRISPIRTANGGPPAVIWLAINITRKKNLEEELKRFSITDSLTGIYNRRHFLDSFRKEFAAVRRYEGALSLLMLDIDHFKGINDTYGHGAGDTVLREFARTCGSFLRESDILARIGGEEFGVLLPGTPLEGAARTAEKLRKAHAGHAVSWDENSIVSTVSVGASALRHSDTGIKDLLKRSDEALYEAKRLGRDRTISRA